MHSERQCEQCGRRIPWGQAECPFCAGRGGYLWSLRRETFLLLTIVLLILLFVVAGFAVKLYHDVERGYAQEWYSRGERDMRAGRAESALIDFRTALVYARDNDRYKLRLAQALAMPGIPRGTSSEARIYLMDLLERQPGSAAVNLELARLAARDHAVLDALRFYHGAIYGEWTGDAVEERRSARLELVEFLLGASQNDAARAELISLAADLPPDPVVQTKVGMLLLRVKGYEDALRLFQQALLERPHFPTALEGAGECHFQMGNYQQASHFLRRALDQDPTLTQAAVTLTTVRSVLENDPFVRGLGNSERAQRAVFDFNIALARLDACAGEKGIDLKATGGDSLQTLHSQAAALQPQAEAKLLAADPELRSRVMDTAFEIEQSTARACGQPEGMDRVLLLMAREQAGARP